MKGKICLVTGANAGIGKVTALELAKMGATVVMVCRDRQKGEAALAEIQQTSQNPNVTLMLADLSSQADIRRLAAAYKTNYSQLHVLVNNAGGVFTQRQVSADGFELTFALNHLGYFLLTNLLLDVLKASAPSRVVVVSSDAHRGGRINFDDLQASRSYQGFGTYSQSKLANVLFAYELAQRLTGTGVTVNALHPGFVASNFGKNNGRFFKLIFDYIVPFLAISPEKGAETSVYLASSPEVEGITGKYFVRKRAVSSSSASYDATTARRLWEISQQLTEGKT